ncbi:MAG TPA: alpha-L-fucosidase [Terriglobia bacterium]|nr:alpha-L-fucosidase [Terriglobia bacterium]
MQRRQFLNKSIAASGGLFGLGKSVAFADPGLQGETQTDNKPTKKPVFDWHNTKRGFPKTVNPEYRHAPQEALEAWKDQKFGIRVHWGLYCLMGSDASWCLPYSSREFQNIYNTLYEFFNPTDFDPDSWMDLFQRAGARFFTITTKHHEGFCMWPTETVVKSIRRSPQGLSFSPHHQPNFQDCLIHYSVMDTPYKKDIVGPLIKSARKRGVGVGLYFSHVDWHDPAFAWDPYNFYYDPNYTPQSDPKRWQKFIDQERKQLTELMTWYGPIDLLSLDIAWPAAASKDIADLAMMLRRLQPNVLMRRRGIGPYGDYYTPEREIPADFSQGNWMVIYPGGQAFSYLPNDVYRPKEWVLESLIDIVAKGGNFQVGYGPMPNGTWPQDTVERLSYVGDWLNVNGEAIYATRSWKVYKQGEDVRFTRSKDSRNLFAISLKWPGNRFVVDSVRAVPGSPVLMLGVEKPLRWQQQGSSVAIEIPPEAAANKPCQQAFVMKIRMMPD